ncbi:MAG: hypothetical protein KC800_15785 [Candidatus Eremiobacteraeota bacterium]|nr:hypothetical protein [Candidatus Eremiobacteraeota bacterium]
MSGVGGVGGASPGGGSGASSGASEASGSKESTGAGSGTSSVEVSKSVETGTSAAGEPEGFTPDPSTFDGPGTLSGSDAKSDPANSTGVTSVQAETAEAITGPAVSDEEDSGVEESESAATRGLESAAEADESADAEAETTATEVAPEAEQAAAVAGEKALTPEQETAVADYHAKSDRISELTTEIFELNPVDPVTGRIDLAKQELSDQLRAERLSLQEEIAPLDDAYEAALDAVKSSFETAQEEAEMGRAFMSSTGTVLDEDQAAAAAAAVAEKMDTALAPMEAATTDLVAALDDPVFQAVFEDMSPAQQQQFFDDMAQYMPHTDAGKGWVSGFTDGLAELGTEGATSNVYSEVAEALRSELSPEQVEALDSRLGLMVGTDLAARPDLGDNHLNAVAEGLGLSRDELGVLDALAGPNAPDLNLEDLGSFTQAVSFSYGSADMVSSLLGGNAFAQGSTVAEGVSKVSKGASRIATELSEIAAKSLKSNRAIMAGLAVTSQLGSQLGKFAERTSTAFAVGSAAYKFVEGDTVGGIAETVGIVGGLLAGSTSTGGLGVALIGASMLVEPVYEEARYSMFKNDILNQVLGPQETLAGNALRRGSAEDIETLAALTPEGMTLAQAFQQRVSGYGSAPANIGTDFFWETIAREFQFGGN